MNLRSLFLLLLVLFSFWSSAQVKTDAWLQQLIESSASPFLKSVLAQPDTFQYQVIYTRIDRNKNNKPRFTHYYLNVDRSRYFNPASTVKLPAALAALEKLNDLKLDGVSKFTSVLTDSSYSGQTPVLKDTSSRDGYPSVAHYIRKIFLVSDNDAYNRLYEFVGQQTLNEKLHKKGYGDVRITRRFVSMTEEENRHTNAVRFIKNGKVMYDQPAAYSTFPFDFSRQVWIGNAHFNRNDSLVRTPMDFTKHNNLPLEDLHRMVQSVMFPKSVSKKQRFHLTPDDYQFLYRYMSAYPPESKYPAYDTAEFFDSYTKFFFKGDKQKPPSNIRIFNKTGWSYGFLTDAAYVTDFANGIEFLLSAVIYVNADGVLNDNKYEYTQNGYPFFRELYTIIYSYEKERPRKYKPDLTAFQTGPED